MSELKPSPGQQWRLKSDANNVATLQNVEYGGLFGGRVEFLAPWTVKGQLTRAMDVFLKYYEPLPAPCRCWRQHSRHFAKGVKPPRTLAALQAAWDRDQELIYEQRAEIARLKKKLNKCGKK